MAVESNMKLIIPGTPLYALLKRNKGNTITITTPAGEEQGILSEFSQTYLTIVTDTSLTKYVLMDNVVSFSFS